MRPSDALRLIGRALRKPRHVVVQRAAQEFHAQADRYLAPWHARRFDARRLLRACGERDIESLWQRLARRPYPAHTARVDPREYERLCTGDAERVRLAAEEAVRHRVRLLGPETFELGERIDWLRDFRSGVAWPRGYMRDLAYVNPHDSSDVKVAWDLSRLHWLLPAGQAYLLDGDERWAEAARRVLDDWIEANPYAWTVNWSCTMEVALRILSWTWLFRAFHASRAWSDAGFRERFLCALYLHGDFTERYLEYSDVNGNHCTADAAGLVFAGLFFRPAPQAERWLERGWSLLVEELPRQVYADGVDFEASAAYHRLVAELFLLPALYRQACGLDVPAAYRQRLVAMARFTAAYSRPDGGTPLWGDADDARALPLGGQPLTDHRYLAAVVGLAFDEPELREASAGSRSEAFWLLGPEAAARLPAGATPPRPPGSTAFPEGGCFVMRGGGDHVFIDCGRVGLADRGGHGHNDCLSFEAALDGVQLVSDCGSFVYTRSFAERNLFRSTAYHNTPRVDGVEINSIDPTLLWHVGYLARPELREFETGAQRDRFTGAHAGYTRLAQPVTPVRTITLDRAAHALVVRDDFEGSGQHRFEVPLHLASGVAADEAGPGLVELRAGGRAFSLEWSPLDEWSLSIEAGRVSPSYGVALPVARLLWTREGETGAPLVVRIAPEPAR
jgi:heparinase II/III-like protein